MSFWSTPDSSLNSHFTLLTEKIKTILFIKKPHNKRWLLNPINSNSHLLSRYDFNRRSGDNLLKCQLDSSCVIMFLILMTTLFYKAMLLQGEIWRWSLLGLIAIWCTVNSHQDGDLWNGHLVPAPGGIPLYKPSGWVFVPFWSENGYTLSPFWSGIRHGFRGNYGSVWTYLSFLFQMSTRKKEKYADSKWIWRVFCLPCYLSNDNIISA